MISLTPPQTLTMLSIDPLVLQIDTFCDADQAQSLIQTIPDAEMTMAGVGEQKGQDKNRTALTQQFPKGTSEFVDAVRAQVASMINVDARYCEMPTMIRYNAGSEYKPHFDSTVLQSMPGSHIFGKAGPRFFTGVLYLNDDFEGGATDFPRIPVTIAPKAGRLVFWSNTALESANPHVKSLHAGLPVTRGQKNILSFWLHTPVGEKIMAFMARQAKP